MTDTHVDLMDPPSLGRLDWKTIAKQVRAHQGEWCRVPRPFNPTVAMHIRRGAYPQVLPSEFEVTTRKCYEVPGKSWIFLRTRAPKA